MSDLKPTSIRLDESTLRQLDAIASVRQVSRSELLTQVVQEFVSSQGLPISDSLEGIHIKGVMTLTAVGRVEKKLDSLGAAIAALLKAREVR